MIRAKHNGREFSYELIPGETIHERLSAEFDLDPTRLKLLCKGKNYSSVLPASATAQLIEQCRDGAVVMVMGTPRSQQLDRPLSLLERASRLVARTPPFAVVKTRARDLFLGVLSWSWLFISSAFMKKRRRGGAAAGQPP